MKKVFKVALSCICLASVFACSACGGGSSDPEGYSKTETLNGKTTEQTYEFIMEQIDGYKENFTSTVNYDIVCDVKYAGQKMSFDIGMDTTVKMDGENFIEVDNVNGGEMLGTMLMNVWYVDGVAYVDGSGSGNFAGMVASKVKYTATIDQICEIAGLDKGDIFNPIYDFSDTSFEDVKFYVGENDSYFQLVLKGDDAANFAEKYAVMQNLDADITIPQINYKFMLDKDGNFTYAKIDYEMVMELEISGSTAEYTYTYDGVIRFSDIGTTVVAAPESGETFTDLSAYLPVTGA